MRRPSTTPSSIARRNGVPWKNLLPKYSSQVSGCASKCTTPSGPWRRASDRRIGSETEWSPPTHTGVAPACTTASIRRSTASNVRSMEIGTTSTSPPVDPHARDRAQEIHRLHGQRLLVLAHPLHAELLEILDGRGETDSLGDRRRAGLEPPRQVVPGGAIHPDFLDHLAASPRGLERLEQRPAAVQHTESGRAQHLVGGERVKIAFQHGHIKR